MIERRGVQYIVLTQQEYGAIVAQRLGGTLGHPSQRVCQVAHPRQRLHRRGPDRRPQRLLLDAMRALLSSLRLMLGALASCHLVADVEQGKQELGEAAVRHADGAQGAAAVDRSPWLL